MERTHTPGPWFADQDGRIWRRHPSELYQNGGGVAGDKPIALVQKGWYEENEQGFPVEANARLIAAAPDLLEALESIVSDHDFCGDEWGSRRDAWIETARAAIAKATGEATC